MRIGSLARSQNNFMALFATAASALLPLATFGQSRYGPAPNQGPMQALYTAPAEGAMAGPASRYVDADGNPLILPASYCQQCGGLDGPCDECTPCGGAPMMQ